MLTFIIFIAILSVLVFVHEMGHYLTARRFKIGVDEFGMGLPPRALGLQKVAGLPAQAGKWKLLFGSRLAAPVEESMVYSLNWIPVGGFVKIRGENGENNTDPSSFGSKPAWQRAIVLAAGVTMNVILCVVLLAIGFSIGMPSVVGDQLSPTTIVRDVKVQVMEVLPESGAAQAGLKGGDVITAVDGLPVARTTELRSAIHEDATQVDVTYVRDGDSQTIPVSVSKIGETTGIGVSVFDVGLVRYPWYQAIWQGIVTTGLWVVAIISSFGMLIYNLIVGSPAGVDVAGPVGIAVLTGKAARLGLSYVLQFAALLSLNLAIVNILPFPALDGGRLLFLAIEKIRGRAVKQRFEALAHNIGFALLMLLIVVITYRDIARYGGQAVSALRRVVGL